MKLGVETKLGKGNTETSKISCRSSCRQIVTSLSFFQFMTDLEQFESRISDAWFISLHFLLIPTFHLTKTEKTLKNL